MMAWSLLFMLAMYDLCAVLTPCGPLKALVNLMSRDDAPEMPGLLYEAELPPEARRPGVPHSGCTGDNNRNSSTVDSVSESRSEAGSSEARSYESEGPRIEIPLAVAQVYNLSVLGIPENSQRLFNDSLNGGNNGTAQRPLLQRNGDSPDYTIPENPSRKQLKADVFVQLPIHGGRIERIKRKGKTVYMERNRHGDPKRILWVDRQGRVFAESIEYGLDYADEEKGRNSIRLGLGDFIFYSVLVAKAAEYSFTTFVVCMLVILAGLGGTLILLSVFHHALPALPISICLGIFFYIVTRFLVQPWLENILNKPCYV
jgi:presenilin 1